MRKLQREAHITWKTIAITWGAFLILILWLCVKAGAAWQLTRGAPDTFMDVFLQQELLVRPFTLEPYDSLESWLLTGVLAWAVMFAFTYKSVGKFRQGAEHGTAQWGNPKQLRKLWEQDGAEKGPDGSVISDPNIILSREMRIGISNTGQTRKNKNVLVIGGSGTRKSTGLVMPNIMQCNSSIVVTDPSGELYNGCGRLLESRGYKVKCLNLVDMAKSHRTNPFAYITKPEHVGTLATSFIQNTRDRNKPSGGDPFWDEAMKLLLMALIAYIWEFEPKASQNFDTLTEMVRAGRLHSDDMDAKSDLDHAFERIGKTHPDSLAWKNYLLYMGAPPKTRASVVVTLAARLGVFNIPAVSELTRTDELELDRMGDEKQALFCVIPQAETTYNFLVGLVYTSLFSALYKRGEEMPRERADGKNFLNRPVQVLMDEFANVAVPDSFEQVLATCRKYEISICIFLQNMTQLKKLYEKDWESIAGNCDSLIYLGGNESFTWKYISEALDKETIKIRTGGKSGSNFSENEQVSGRDLMTKGEVRGLPDDKCIVMVRGEYGVIDDKYDITKHPNFREIAMGGAPNYTQEFRRAEDSERSELERMQQEMLMTEYPLEADGEVYQGGLTRAQASRLRASQYRVQAADERRNA